MTDDEVFSILLPRRPSSVPYFTSEVSGMEWLNIYGHVQFRIKFFFLNSGYCTSDSLLTSATFTHNFLRSWTQLKLNCSLLQTTVFFFLLYLIPHEPKELSDQTTRRRHKIHQLTARTKLARRAPTWFIPRKMYSTACFQIFQRLSHSMRNHWRRQLRERFHLNWVQLEVQRQCASVHRRPPSPPSISTNPTASNHYIALFHHVLCPLNCSHLGRIKEWRSACLMRPTSFKTRRKVKSPSCQAICDR